MARPPAPANRKSSAKVIKKDNYARHVAVIVVALLACSLAVYAYLHTKDKVGKVENYQALPQVILQSKDQVVRLQMTVQVDEKDHDWLEKNKTTINEIFRRTLDPIDPVTFRDNAGRVAVQARLREEINRQMKVNKVVDMLYGDLIIQTKDAQ